MRQRFLYSLVTVLISLGLSAQTTSLAGQSLDFSAPLTANPSLIAGGTCVYDNVFTVGANSYDAIVRIETINNALISDFDNTSTTNSNTAAHFSPEVLWTAAGSIDYSITFVEDGTAAAPVLVNIGDFHLSAWDLDGIGPAGVYFESDGVDSYSLGALSFLSYTTSGAGNGRFTNSATTSNTTGTDGRSRVTVSYASTNRIDFSIGSASAGNKTYLISSANPNSWFPTTEVSTSFPTLTTYTSLSPFFTCDAAASAAQTFLVEGRNLTGALTLNAPSGYEISNQSTAGWTTSLVINADSTGRMDTTVYVRMNGSTPLANVTSIAISTPGYSGSSVAVSGTKGGTLNVSNFAGTNPNACGASDGSITFNIENVADGSYPISYQGGMDTATVSGGVATISNLEEGHYLDVVLTDSSGCSTEMGKNITLSEPIDFTVNYSPTDKDLCIGNTTTFGVITTGTTVTYQWRNFAANSWANLTGATLTTYTTASLTDTAYFDVRVTSAAGCRWTAPRVAANVHGLPTAALVSTPASCPGTADGAIDLTQNSGQLPMTYQWSNGFSTEDLSNIPSGSYTVTMLDPIGCEGSASITVSDSDGVAPIVYAKDITIALDSLGQVSITTADIDSASSDNCNLDLSISDSIWNCTQIGADTIMLIGTDGSQSDTDLAVITIVDLSAPQITCGADTTIYTALDTSGAPYNWAAPILYDNCGVDSSWSSDSSGAWFAIGIYDIYTYAIDASGNLDSCSFTLTVADNLAPSFTSCLLDTTMYADALNCGANLTWTTPTANDNSDSIFYTSTDTSGAFFIVGIDTVMIFAHDLSGNTDTCSFIVTVIDTIAPSWTGSLDTLIVQAGMDTCGLFSDSVSLTAPPIVEACGIDTLYNNADTYYALGSHDIYWFVTDVHGNTDSILQKLVIEETVAPEIYCPGDTLVFAAAADSTWTQVTWTGDSVWDVCGMDTSYFSLANGGYLPLGFFKIDFFAFDVSGNSDTCSFFIDILDTTAPAFVGTLSDTTLYTTQDSCSVYYAWIQPTIEENSTNFTSTSNVAAPNGNFGIGTHTVYYTVIDAAGLSDSIGFTITVVDNLGPALYTNTQSLTLDSDGFATLSVAQVDSGSFDCSGIDTLWITQELFVCTDVGSPVVWFHGIDSLGYHDSVQVPLTVLPNPAGVIQSILATTDVLCFGDSNGTATIGATGGSLPYAYSWTTGDTTQSISGLAAGTYNYHVSDTNGCVFQTNFTIGSPAALTISHNTSDYNGYGISSEGANDGSIDITVGGGATPYSYSWNNNVTTEDQSGLSEGTYIVIVTDTNGCFISDTITLSEPDELSVDVIVLSDNICPDDNDGIIYAGFSGGVGPMTITWLNGFSGDTLTGLNSGLYIVTVVDTNGAFATDSAYIISYDEDCDGILNDDEGGIPGGGGGMADTDGDGIPNQQDSDSDGDGIADALEYDTNGDGIPFDDCDGDGIPDFLDADLCAPKPATVMTPNGDGRNDFWEIPEILQYPNTSVRIYNRHGILVYFSDNYANEFNGNANVQTYLTNDKRELPTGTYYYYILFGGTDLTMNGYLFINR